MIKPSLAGPDKWKDVPSITVKKSLILEFKQFFEDYIEQCGPCSHDVNICICYEKDLLREIEEVLK